MITTTTLPVVTRQTAPVGGTGAGSPLRAWLLSTPECCDPLAGVFSWTNLRSLVSGEHACAPYGSRSFLALSRFTDCSCSRTGRLRSFDHACRGFLSVAPAAAVGMASGFQTAMRSTDKPDRSSAVFLFRYSPAGVTVCTAEARELYRLSYILVLSMIENRKIIRSNGHLLISADLLVLLYGPSLRKYTDPSAPSGSSQHFKCGDDARGRPSAEMGRPGDAGLSLRPSRPTRFFPARSRSLTFIDARRATAANHHRPSAIRSISPTTCCP